MTGAGSALFSFRHRRHPAAARPGIGQATAGAQTAADSSAYRRRSQFVPVPMTPRDPATGSAMALDRFGPHRQPRELEIAPRCMGRDPASQGRITAVNPFGKIAPKPPETPSCTRIAMRAGRALLRTGARRAVPVRLRDRDAHKGTAGRRPARPPATRAEVIPFNDLRVPDGGRTCPDNAKTGAGGPLSGLAPGPGRWFCPRPRRGGRVVEGARLESV